MLIVVPSKTIRTTCLDPKSLTGLRKPIYQFGLPVPWILGKDASDYDVHAVQSLFTEVIRWSFVMTSSTI